MSDTSTSEPVPTPETDNGTEYGADSIKVLKRSAYLVRRRSETHDNIRGDVVYYFLIQFCDGSEGEFRFPGRGVSEELYSNGMTGVAFTRGDELLHMERVRI